MKRFATSLKVTLALGFSAVLLTVCLFMVAVFDHEVHGIAKHAAQEREAVAMRLLLDRLGPEAAGLDIVRDGQGAPLRLRGAAGGVEARGSEAGAAVTRITGDGAGFLRWEAGAARLVAAQPAGAGFVPAADHPAAAALRAGQGWSGAMDLPSGAFHLRFLPVLDAAGALRGALYVAVDCEGVDSHIHAVVAKMVGLNGLAIGLGVLVMLALLARSLRPLERISLRLHAMAADDLDSPVPGAERPDSLGAAARAVDALRASLRRAAEAEAIEAQRRREQGRVVAALRAGLARLAERDLTVRIEGPPFPEEYRGLRDDFDAGVASLAAALDRAEEAAAILRTSAAEINQTGADIAHRVAGQAATLVQSAEALNRLAGVSKQVAAQIEDADALAETSRRLADDSGAVVRDAIAAINRIEATSETIGQIITAIDDIAFQTNLLALNAGVEAARAGSAGKGFAVVASEVRSLAQTAARSAQEIKALVTASGEEVRQGSDLVQRSGSALMQVQDQVEKLGTLMSGVAEAVRDQTASTGEINESVQHLEGTTQQNAAVVEQLTAAGRGLDCEAERLTATLARFCTRAMPSTPAEPPAAGGQDRAGGGSAGDGARPPQGAGEDNPAPGALTATKEDAPGQMAREARDRAAPPGAREGWAADAPTAAPQAGRPAGSAA
jgi:methyl-accepting chemotaxis protein